MSNWLAIIYGFTVGLALVLITEFLVWKYLYPSLVLYHVSFWDFLLPENIYDFREFVLARNPFFRIGIINIIASSCLGWQINKSNNHALLVKE
ncbi:MAG: hypothetical protein EHM40_14740 [Chloroflexi bacterium]|nr:MAG: hypothetical protein EHM40_14740 [Chloroflexota bacterium]